MTHTAQTMTHTATAAAPMALAESPVTLDTACHIYTAPDGSHPTGITSFVSWLFPDTYQGVSDEAMTAARQRGSAIHLECQLATEMGVEPGPECLTETRAYFTLLAEAGLTPRRAEYLISDPGRPIASSIDAVATAADGQVTLIDIKTTSQIHIPNVTTQLSLYADLFERQNPGLRVARLIAAWLPRPLYSSPRLYDIDRLATAPLTAALDAWISGDGDSTPWRRSLFPDLIEFATERLPATIADAEAALIAIEAEARRVKARRERLADGLRQLMERSGTKRWTGDRVTITYVAPATRQSLDTKALRADHPDIARAYTRETPTAASVRIKINDND